MASVLMVGLLLTALDGGVDAGAEEKAEATDGGFDLKLVPLVAPGYSPELSFVVVAGGAATWRASGSPRSSVAAVAGVSTIGAFLTQTRLTSFWMEDRVRLAAFVDVRDQPDHFFGVGFQNGFTRPQGADTTAYRRTAWQVNPHLQVLMRPSLFFGTVMDFSGTLANAVSPGMAADPDFQRGGARIINSGLGFSLTWDTRDVPVNPRTGMLVSAQWLAYGSWFGGTTLWQSLTLDYRQFVTLFREGSVLSWEFKHRSTWGAVPWSDLSQLGTPWDLRAYRWGRYRDTSATFALLEYRFMFPFPPETIWSRLGAAAWVGVGALGSGFLPDVTQLLPAAGLGLRARVQDRVTLRFDFGVGRSSYAFYFQFLEAF
jgi:hypothetical protein